MKEIQICCIPYAGGTAEVFYELGQYLPEYMKLIAADYSGHGSRRGEAYYKTFQELVTDMADHVNEMCAGKEEIALFGYSMGSIAAYEMLAQGLLKARVNHLFLAAHEAPGEAWESATYAKLDDLDFAHKLKGLGGFDRFEDNLLDNRHFRKLFFEPIREDYRLLADYKLSHENKPDVPVTIFHAVQDVPEEDICKWSARFASEPNTFR